MKEKDEKVLKLSIQVSITTIYTYLKISGVYIKNK